MKSNQFHDDQDIQANAEPELRIRHGAYLPHWTREEATYAVTFRLHDSLPRQVLEEWLFEREKLLRVADQQGRPLSASEQDRLRRLHSEKVERYLDAGHGACYMNRADLADIVAESMTHFDAERYELLAWCVMPNHVHCVVSPFPGFELAGILHSWKSYSAKAANKVLGRKGQFWQDEYYDHLIRDESDLARQVEYVLSNPASAGLRDWKWVGGRSLG